MLASDLVGQSAYSSGVYSPTTAPSPNETPESAYVALRDAGQEAAQASVMFIDARTRWTNAQAQLAEAHDRVKRAHEAFGI